MNEKTNFAENIQNNALAGAGNVGNRIADYYIKRAESISPVVQIPSGAKLDVVLTEGVYFGQLNTKELINEKQNEKNFDF